LDNLKVKLDDGAVFNMTNLLPRQHQEYLARIVAVMISSTRKDLTCIAGS
jgi:hypothetical protein